MGILTRPLVISIFAYMFTISGHGQGDPPAYTAQFINGAPTLDGTVSPGEWDLAEVATVNRVLRGEEQQMTSSNFELRILWNEEAMYLLLQTDLATWPGGTGGFGANNNLNLYIDPNNDEEENGFGRSLFDGYHPAIYPDMGKTSRFATAFDNQFRDVYHEASINADFGGADWPSSSSLDMGTAIDYVADVGPGGGVIEICMPWLIFDSRAGTDDEIYHPFAPEIDDQWFVQIGLISAGPELLPVWSWTPEQVFAARPHAVVTFAGTPTPFIITEVDVDDTAGTATITWNSKTNGVYAVDASDDLKSWEELTDNVVSAGELTSFTESEVGGAGRRFYRVREF